jgi:hypothetical protein
MESFFVLIDLYVQRSVYNAADNSLTSVFELVSVGGDRTAGYIFYMTPVSNSLSL